MDLTLLRKELLLRSAHHVAVRYLMSGAESLDAAVDNLLAVDARMAAAIGEPSIGLATAHDPLSLLRRQMLNDTAHKIMQATLASNTICTPSYIKDFVERKLRAIRHLEAEFNKDWYPADQSPQPETPPKA